MLQFIFTSDTHRFYMNAQFEQALSHFRQLTLKSAMGQGMTMPEQAFLKFGEQFLSPLQMQQNDMPQSLFQKQMVSMHQALLG